MPVSINELAVADEKIRSRYREIDNAVIKLLNADDYGFYIDRIREHAIKDGMEALNQKRDFIDGLYRELDILRQQLSMKELSIRALQKENNLIWESSINQIAEEKMKVRDLGNRWGDLLKNSNKE